MSPCTGQLLLMAQGQFTLGELTALEPIQPYNYWYSLDTHLCGGLQHTGLIYKLHQFWKVKFITIAIYGYSYYVFCIYMCVEGGINQLPNPEGMTNCIISQLAS